MMLEAGQSVELWWGKVPGVHWGLVPLIRGLQDKMLAEAGLDLGDGPVLEGEGHDGGPLRLQIVTSLIQDGSISHYLIWT